MIREVGDRDRAGVRAARRVGFSQSSGLGRAVPDGGSHSRVIGGFQTEMGDLVFRNPVVLGLILAVIGAGGVFAYQYFGGGAQNADYSASCGYPTCGWVGHVTIKAGDPYPPRCPKCGKNSVLPLAKCKKCGNQQNLNEELRVWLPEMKGLPNKTKCNKCGGPIVHGD